MQTSSRRCSVRLPTHRRRLVGAHRGRGRHGRDPCRAARRCASAIGGPAASLCLLSTSTPFSRPTETPAPSLRSMRWRRRTMRISSRRGTRGPADQHGRCADRGHLSDASRDLRDQGTRGLQRTGIDLATRGLGEPLRWSSRSRPSTTRNGDAVPGRRSPINPCRDRRHGKNTDGQVRYALSAPGLGKWSCTAPRGVRRTVYARLLHRTSDQGAGAGCRGDGR